MSHMPQTPCTLAGLTDLQLFNELKRLGRLSIPLSLEAEMEAYRADIEAELAKRAGCDGTEPTEGFAVRFGEASH